MKLHLDHDGRIDYDGISGSATVQDLLDAIELFLQDHPLPCGGCADSCCKKAWAVEVDNVAARRITNYDEAAKSMFVRERLALKWNHSMGFRQYVLKKETACGFVTGDNLCTIYAQRPVICRLYICAAGSGRYGILRELVAATYLQALVFEENMKRKQLSASTLRKYRRNPAIRATDYSLPLQDIITYAQWTGWLGQ